MGIVSAALLLLSSDGKAARRRWSVMLTVAVDGLTENLTHQRSVPEIAHCSHGAAAGGRWWKSENGSLPVSWC